MVIQRLEKRWGAKLIERRGKRVYLTEAGAALYAHALRTLRSGRELEDQVGRIGAPDSAAVQVFTRGPLATHFVPLVLARFWKEHPDARVQVSDVGGSLVFLRDILTDGSRLAVLTRGAGVIVSPGVEIEEIGREPRIFVVAPDHPLAHGDEVTLEELSREPLVVGSRQPPHILALREQFNSAGLQLRIAMELVGDGARTLVRQGVGVGLMLRINVEADLRTGALCHVNVPELDLYADLLMGYRDAPGPDPSTAALMQLIREFGACRQEMTV